MGVLRQELSSSMLMRVLHHQLDQLTTSQVSGKRHPHQYDPSHISQPHGRVTSPEAFVSNTTAKQPQHRFKPLPVTKGLAVADSRFELFKYTIWV